jgi:lipid-A-disaccharide synthase
MVWAWKEKRVHQVAARVDRLLCLLPNEPPYFEAVGLDALHVGHPVLEAVPGDGAAFRRRHALPEPGPLLAVLPGSRHSETSRLLPVFGEVVDRLAARHADLRIVVPTVETVAAEVEQAVKAWALPVVVVRGATERVDAFAASRAALAASGTVALELALAGVPMAIAYRAAPLTALLWRRLLKVPYACLVNLLLNEPVVPEFLQERCRTDLLSEAVDELLTDERVRATQLAGARRALNGLGMDGEPPSVRAARAVLAMLA